MTTRWVVAGSGICRTRMPAPTDVPPRIPEAAGGWTDCVLRQDGDGHWWYESLSGAALSGWVEEALRNPLPASDFHIAWGDADRESHRRGVLDCLEAIAAGEIYQACVCTQFAGALDGAPIDFFVDAVERTSPARAAYLAGDWGAVASLSPELFLRRVGEAVTSSPIKGTLPRSADPAALRASVKDVAENIMIVDLVRNDLSRVAVTGSVTVPELLAVQACARRVASGVDGVGARAGRRADGRTARRRVPAGVGHRHAEVAGPSAAGGLGVESTRSILRHSRFGVADRRKRTQRGDQNRGVRRRRLSGARRRRRHHSGLRPGPRMGRMPAQGGADHRR